MGEEYADERNCSVGGTGLILNLCRTGSIKAEMGLPPVQYKAGIYKLFCQSQYFLASWATSSLSQLLTSAFVV